MARYIDADKAKKEFGENFGSVTHAVIANRIIDEIPTEDVEIVRHAEWIEDGYDDFPCVCSYCGEEAPHESFFDPVFEYDYEENLQPRGYEENIEYIKTQYCPHCGAKMDGGRK